MKEAMRKGLISLITGAATVASPMAFAAQDTSGMQYTSAAEGFYASIRARYISGRAEDDGADIENGSSRIGVRGTNDLGGGLSGFYQYELGVGIENGSDTSTRLGHVGLRGNFGEVVVGSIWDQAYNWTHGSTDIANTHSGYLNYGGYGGQLPGRISKALQYTTPDLNGFQAALRVSMDKGTDGEGGVAGDKEVWTVTDDSEGTVVVFESESDANAYLGTLTPDTNDAVEEVDLASTNPEDDNDLDNWALSAKYSVQGFDVAASYLVTPDGLDGGEEDYTTYVLKAGYAQDNWYVNAWYSEDNAEEGGNLQDQERVSIAGGVSVEKVNVYALYESIDGANEDEDSHATFGVQYNLGSNSRVWVEYASQDMDSDDTADDYVNIGMRHDF